MSDPNGAERGPAGGAADSRLDAVDASGSAAGAADPGLDAVDASGHRLLDFAALLGRLRIAAGILGVVSLGGLVVEGLVKGLTFEVMVRWATIFAVALLAAAAIVVAVHALRGADTAQRRGERLSGGDVGLAPPRRDRE